MLYEASDYRFVDVSNIDVTGEIIPVRERMGLRKHPLRAEDLAFIAEAMRERFYFEDIPLTIGKELSQGYDILYEALIKVVGTYYGWESGLSSSLVDEDANTGWFVNGLKSECIGKFLLKEDFDECWYDFTPSMLLSAEKEITRSIELDVIRRFYHDLDFLRNYYAVGRDDCRAMATARVDYYRDKTLVDSESRQYFRREDWRNSLIFINHGQIIVPNTGYYCKSTTSAYFDGTYDYIARSDGRRIDAYPGIKRTEHGTVVACLEWEVKAKNQNIFERVIKFVRCNVVRNSDRSIDHIEINADYVTSDHAVLAAQFAGIDISADDEITAKLTDVLGYYVDGTRFKSEVDAPGWRY